MMLHIITKSSGTKEWTQVTADTPHELNQAARATGAAVHHKGAQAPHLDLNKKQVERIEKVKNE